MGAYSKHYLKDEKAGTQSEIDHKVVACNRFPISMNYFDIPNSLVKFEYLVFIWESIVSGQ